MAALYSHAAHLQDENAVQHREMLLGAKARGLQPQHAIGKAALAQGFAEKEPKLGAAGATLPSVQRKALGNITNTAIKPKAPESHVAGIKQSGQTSDPKSAAGARRALGDISNGKATQLLPLRIAAPTPAVVLPATAARQLLSDEAPERLAGKPWAVQEAERMQREEAEFQATMRAMLTPVAPAPLFSWVRQDPAMSCE
jgi:hypothetical protein